MPEPVSDFNTTFLELTSAGIPIFCTAVKVANPFSANISFNLLFRGKSWKLEAENTYAGLLSGAGPSPALSVYTTGCYDGLCTNFSCFLVCVWGLSCLCVDSLVDFRMAGVSSGDSKSSRNSEG